MTTIPINTMITPATIISRRQEIMASNVSDTETVMLNIDKNSYYGMDETAHEIWELIAEPCSVEDVVTRLLTIFAVDKESCQKQVLRFLDELHSEGLIDVRDPA